MKTLYNRMNEENAFLVKKGGECILKYSQLDIKDKGVRKVLRMMEILQKENEVPTYEQLFDMTDELKIDRRFVKNVIKSLLREGWMIEPWLGCYRLICEVGQ